MADYTKIRLSGSTNGRGIKVAATATAGTLIHTAHADDDDEIWLYAYNHHTADVNLTVEFGGVTVPDDVIQVSVPFKSGLKLIIPGFPLTGGVVVRAFAGTADVVVIRGFVNRITET
jgi:hypothetical protein